jgi:hypothetical protein
MPRRKGSGLRSYEKELPERRSGELRHKNIPAQACCFKFDLAASCI